MRKTLTLSAWLGRRLSLLLMMVIMAGSVAKADGYITDLAVIGCYYKSEISSLQSSWTSNGWTVINKDLNSGAGESSWFVYLAYKTSTTANPETGYITDIIASPNLKNSITLNGRTYTRITGNSGFSSDLNRGASGPNIYLYATRSRTNLGTSSGGVKRVITGINISTSSSGTPICWGETYSGACDANKGAGGDYIYMHMAFTTQTLSIQNHPTMASGLVYDGNSKTLVASTSSNYGTMKYRVNGGSWSTNLPTATNVGNYNVEYYLEAYYANSSGTASRTVTINPPVVAPVGLSASFNQREKRVELNWSAPTIPGNYKNYQWQVYRGNSLIETLHRDSLSYKDKGFPYESNITYSVYYVSDFWSSGTKTSGAGASKQVGTTRTVPVNGLKADSKPDRIVFTWTSTGLPANWGNKFEIYVDNESTPIATITPTAGQTDFQWEHRTTDKHTDRQSKTDATTGVKYVEEPLNGCQPHNYRVVGLADNKKLNEASQNGKAIGSGTIFYSFDATKGAFPGTVKLSWHVDLQGSTTAKTYIIDRRRAEKEDEPWVTLHRTASDEEYLFYTDDTPLPGVYYDYRVTVQDKCSDGTIISTDDTDIGFAQTTGTVSGRVTYGTTGSAVANVDVVVEKTGASGESSEQYHSMRFTDTNGAVIWQYPDTAYARKNFATGDFSIQMWINPEEYPEQWVARFKDNKAFGISSAGKLLFCDGTTNYDFGLTVKKGKYNHVTLTRSGRTLTCYLMDANSDGTLLVRKATKTLNRDLDLKNATQFELGYMKGFIDEFRLWTKVLTEDEIKENYSHLLVGNEKNLETYWTFDEGLRTQFFDYSRDGTVYRQHHGKIGSNAESSTTTPADLALRAKTDSIGNYIIQGIPFTGEGTTYAVIPKLGVHDFNPTQQLRFVCNNSLVHNSVDFTDISSFPVSGTVYYAGTDYPVEGVSFYVDGMVCSKDGEVIYTGADGTYTISVPIGDHYITVAKGGHVFTDGGRYPADPDGVRTVRNYNSKVVDLDFYDETLVNFTGRVVGGSIEGNKPLGFGESVNNIGVTEFVLTPTNTTPRMNVFKKETETSFSYKTDSVTKVIPSATPVINSHSWRGAGDDDCKKLFIRTDSLTGEFSAMVPPLQYTVSTMNLVKNGREVGPSVAIDLTNPNTVQSDTLYTEDGSDYELYEYNTKLMQTFHENATFTVTQQGRTDGSFGISSYKIVDELGEMEIDDIYTVGTNGTVTYNYGAPLFVKDDSYTFLIEGYEEYTNVDNGIVTHVPLKGNTVVINNALSSQQSVYVEDGTVNGEDVKAGEVADMKSNELTLDDNGKAKYKWTAGLPNIVDPYKRTINIFYDIDGRLIDWSGNSMDAIILGELPTGSNFITSGPDKLLMILRDPPGSYSSATWTTGTSITKSELRGSTFSENFTTKFNHKFGFKNSVITGTPAVGTITEAEAKDELTAGVKVEAATESANTTTWSTTVTTEVSTSGEPDFVGDAGDVFVGNATNIIFGKARNVGFQREATGASLGLKDIITTGLQFGTTFTYTRSYIENTLFPNWEQMLTRFLQYASSQSAINTYVNNTDHVVYLTTLKPGDEGYGQKGTYTAIQPKNPKQGVVYEDSVIWVNTQIANWTKYLKQNEEAKVKAYEKRDKYLKLNRSFDGGASVTYTVEKDTTTNHSYDWTCAAGVVVENTFGFEIAGVGFDCTIEDETTGGRHETDENDTVRVSSFSYTLADEGIDAITVDVYEYDAFSPIFRTRGGQTSNPYEGETVTQYYEPGTTIMEATMQIEVPQIDVDKAIVNDVPTGNAANFNLSLGNASEIGEDVTYIMFMLDDTNANGAKISIDGKVLTDGRYIKVPANQALIKALQLYQTNTSVLDYENIGIVLASESQPEEIADTVYISAHFVPSSSDVTLAISNTTMNTQTGSNLVLTFSNFDRNYKNLKAFRLQHKKQGATDWTLLKEYVLESKNKTDNNEYLPTTGGSVSLNLPMESYTDGDYIFRVVSVATYGPDEVYKYSDELALTKDMMRPRPLGQPEPADGVYDIGDDLSITFNEAILKGELTKTANFEVTGVLNGAEIDHETALNLSDAATAATTEADIMLAGKDFSIDAWVNLKGGAGTLLTHGRGTKKLTVGTNALGRFVVKIGSKTYTSTKSVPTDKWAFLTMNITADGKLSATIADDANETQLFQNRTVVAYDGNGPLAVGSDISGAIHELLLWDEAHDIATALMNRSRSKSPSTRHLIGYWKMNEGEGTEIRDYARNRHMTMADETWYINNKNKAVSLDGQHYVGIPTADLNAFPEDDGAIEFWMRGDKHTAEAQLLQMGEVALWTNKQGELQLTTNGAYKAAAEMESYATSSGNILDNAWHHIALNILRQGAAAVYVDGKRCLTVNGANVGAISTDKLFVGAKRTSVSPGVYNYERPFKGEVDEIRVWNATLNADLLSKNRKIRLVGSEDGLVVYYPFEKKQLDSGNQVQTVGNDADLTGSGHTAQLFNLSAQASALDYTDEAPALRTKPTETNVNFSFVASDNKIVINLDEDPATIEGCTINLTVLSLRDENGNYSEPAKWSVFVDRKSLTWKEDVIAAQQEVKSGSTFTATVVNKGGQQQMWTLSGMPSWLTADADYGTTNPRSESQVTFAVSPATPIGRYEETIYLKGNDNIEVPLTLNFTVTGQVPAWSVNPRGFETSMNVIGRVELEGAPLADPDDIVAAFVGEECRGVAKLEYKERYDGYYATIDIYGNADDETQPVTFRAYDAATGTLYPVVEPNRTIKFEALALIGKYADPVVFTIQDKIEPSTDLKTGWNWISLNVKADDMKAQSVFEKIASDVATIKSQGNGWLMYEDGEWAGSMTTALTNDQMYAVQMNADRNLRVVGKGVNSSNTTITVKPGWNWVSYYGRQVATVADAMAGLQPVDGDILKAQSGVAYFDTYEWAGSIPMMEPGQGYMVKSITTSQRTYGYSAITGAKSPTFNAQSSMFNEDNIPAATMFTPVDFRNYSGNAIMAVQLIDGGMPMANTELGVFADGECRTAAVTNENGIAFLTIPGDDAAVLTFKVVIGEAAADAPETLTYEKDATYGSPKHPFVIDMSDVTGIHALSIDQLESKTIYDLQGRRITAKDVIKNNVYIIDGRKQIVK
ncbi:MAG: hypothetical protein J6129_04155 [Bacteroidaceae bacterium]|nr:hypothetical protein [Bacteroidaceae bacterium]